MSKLKTCEHCEYFKPNPPDAAPMLVGTQNVDAKPGTCLRFPPVPIIMQQNQIAIAAGPAVGMAGVNPPVTSIHTCGEWQRAHVTPSLS